MKMFRKIGAVLLSAAAVLCCGCGDRTVDSSDTAYSAKTQSTVSEAAFTVPQSSPQNVQTDKITYFGSHDISGAAKLFAENSGIQVETETAGSDYINVLSEKISSDASPDLCDKSDNTFPYLISQNKYEDLTNYIDATSPQWADITEYIDYYAFKSARYFYPTSVKLMPQFLMYDKMTYVYCDNASDPEKLWRQGEWTWSAMKSGAEKIRKFGVGDIIYLAGGYNFTDNLFASSGSTMFPKDESGRFLNGFESDAAKTISGFMDETWKIKHNDDDSRLLRMPYSVFLSGDEQTLAKLRQTSIMVGIVPFPVEDGADKYYCKAVTDGFLVPKGAKNIQSAASFINYSRIYETSEENIEANDKKLIDSGLLRSDVEWLQSLRSSEKLTPVLVEGNCFDDLTNNAVQRMLTYDGTEPWDEVLAECSPTINNAVESINAVIE